MKLLKLISIIMVYLVVAMSFSLYAPEEVSAAQQGCCQLTKSGDYCRYTDTNDCDANYQIASNVYCDNIDFCKTGCCYDTSEGSCYTGVAKSRCESSPNSVWNSDMFCNIDQCKIGCCQISNQCALATQAKCRSTASKYPGAEMIFHSSVTGEQECIDQCRGAEEGACVSSDGSCRFTARSDCTEVKSPGSKAGFYLNMLCSHPDLGTNCAPQQATGCVGEDVYWLDSCGNKENIYNSNKKISYNSGYMQKEDQACKASPNDKNCGNCNYLSGTLCGEAKGVKPEYGNYVCKDMNCYNVYKNSASPSSGGNKKHGESWCLYDATIGPGKDVVGSGHKRVICLNGEEVTEPCRDYREEYCIQNKLGEKTFGTNTLTLFSSQFEGYTEAMCKENNFEDCTSCMKEASLEKQKECCSDEKKTCYWAQWGNTASLTSNGLCVPLVPPGLKFWDSSSESVCHQADQTCNVKYKRTYAQQWSGGGWDCVENCQCRNHDWAVNANKYCKAMGDCGSYYNIEGKLTFGGYTLSGNARDKLKVSDLEPWNKLQNPGIEEFINLYSINENAWNVHEQNVANVLYVVAGIAAVVAYAAGAAATAAGTVSSIPVVGWIIAAVALLIALLLSGADSKTETYTFVCEPWEAPDKGEDCEKCNEDNRECTEYLCMSLGKNCELINEGTEDQKCVAKLKTDIAPPLITSGDMDFDILTKESGFEIKGLVKPFTPVELVIDTDEPSQCKVSLEPLKDFEQMDINFGSSLYLNEHKALIPIPSEATAEEVLLATNGGIYNLYVKCKDSSGNINSKDYSIKFQIDPGPDQTPPSVEKALPDNNAPIPYGKNSYDVRILLNEPANCKWSQADKDFTQMENLFTCAQSGLDISQFYPGLYDCTTTISSIKQNQINTYYIRCQDKANNTQQQSYVYKLISTPPLQITDTKPTGKVYTRYPVLEAATSQGFNNGIAVCGFNENNVTLGNMLQMFNTNSTEHSQQLQPAASGQYIYYISCVDKAGNIASSKISFDLEISLEMPQVYNIYKDKVLNILHISTTEDTDCQYLDKSFSYGTGTPMTSPASKDHTAPLGLNVYYIICQDKFNNQMSTIVYP